MRRQSEIENPKSAFQWAGVLNLPNGSLRTKIIVWSSVPAIIILVAVVLVTFTTYQRATEELVIQQDQDLTRLLAGQLATELAEYADLLTVLARTADISQSEPAAQRDALTKASDRLAVFDGGVLILDASGTVVAAEPERPEALGQDWSDRACYRQMTSDLSGMVFSNVVADGALGAEVVCVAVPITGEQSAFLGAMIGMFRLDATAVSAFHDDAVKLHLEESGNAYLVDGNGRVLYHSDASRIGKDLSAQPVTQQVLSGRVDAIRTRDAEGLDIVASFAPVPGTPWNLVVERSWPPLTSRSTSYRQCLLLLLVLGVVASILVVSVGVRRITRPIVELISAAQQVARSNFDQPITARTGDKVEELSSQFNLMATQLQESYAHLEQRVSDRTKELAALNAIATVVSRSLDRQEILEDALAKTLEVMELEAGGIYLLPKNGEFLTIAAYKGLTAQDVAEIDNLKIGEGFSGRVIQTGEPLVVRDLSTHPRSTRLAVRESGFHSLAVLPLVSRGKVLGSLFVTTHGYREFSSQDVELLTSISHQIGVAIENARLFHDTARQVRELRALVDASRIISSVLDQDQLLEALYEQITLIAPADFHLIALYDGATNVVSIEINVDEGVHYPKDRYVLDKGLLTLVIHNQQALRFDSLKEEKTKLDVEIVPSGSAKTVHGWLGVPMLYGDKAVGAIIVASYQRSAFDDGHQQILASVANQAAVALENARLYAEAQQGAEEQAVLNELGQALTARLNVEQVLEEAYRGASRLLDTTNFYIALYDADKDEVTFVINVREGELRKPYTTRQAGQGLTEYIIRHRTALLIEEDFSQRLEEIGVKVIGTVAFSWLGVPLMIGDRVLGVMAVQSYTTPHAYDEHDRDLLTAIASQAAIAIQNAHLFKETSSRAERLAVVNRIASAASATLRLDDLLDTVYREIVPAFQADAFFIALYDKEANELDFCFQVDEGIREPSERVPLGVGLASLVVTEKKPLIIRDDQERERLLTTPRPFGSMKLAVSWLGVPMLVGKRVIGVISVQAYRPHAWGEEDQLLLFTVADQVAVAIENARLFEAEQRRAEQFRVISKVGRHITSILDVDELLEQMVSLIEEAFDYYQAVIGLIEGDEVVFKMVDAPVSDGDQPQPVRLKVGQEGITGWVAQSGEPLLVPDVSQEPRYYYVPQFSDIRSELAVPLKVKGAIIGVLDVLSNQVDAFDESDLVVLQSLAHQAAIAIDNARLFAEAEQRMRQLQALYHADEELYRHLSLDEVLQVLVDVAVDILQADKSSLMEWDGQRERLIVRAARGFHPETSAQMIFSLGEGTVGRVVARGEPIIVEDIHTDPRVAKRVTEPEGIRSFMHFPIKIGDQIFGVFNVDYVHPRSFDEEEQRLFMALAQRAALAIENAQFYEQAQKLAVMEERQRLARDLHDAVTQTLFSASLIAEVLPRLWERDRDEGQRRLTELRELTRGALAEMRTLLLELRPAALVDAELGDLLRQLAESITGRARVPVTVEVEGECSMPVEIKVALYRIAQEALNNVAKHASASQVAVSLRCGSAQVALRVSDDGRGFDPADVSLESLGLGIMHERVEAIGATLAIESEIGRGTEVAIVWTVNNNDE